MEEGREGGKRRLGDCFGVISGGMKIYGGSATSVLFTAAGERGARYFTRGGWKMSLEVRNRASNVAIRAERKTGDGKTHVILDIILFLSGVSVPLAKKWIHHSRTGSLSREPIFCLKIFPPKTVTSFLG